MAPPQCPQPHRSGLTLEAVNPSMLPSPQENISNSYSAFRPCPHLGIPCPTALPPRPQVTSISLTSCCIPCTCHPLSPSALPYHILELLFSLQSPRQSHLCGGRASYHLTTELISPPPGLSSHLTDVVIHCSRQLPP